MADRSRQTEKATPRRIQKAREKGQFVTSRFLTGGIQFLLAVTIISTFFGSWCLGQAELMLALFRRAATAELNASQLISLTRETLIRGLAPLAVAGMAVVAMVLASQLFVTRFGISFKKLALDPNKLNPWNKLKGMAGENMSAFGQALVMIPIFLFLVYKLSWQNLNLYLSLPRTSVAGAAMWVGAAIESLLWKAAMLFVLIGVIDLMRQRFRYNRDLKMSKQEVKDELKELEGNMQMKAKIRRLMRAFSRKRMLLQVRTATAIIVNPTHYAVALRYDMDSKSAPMVVAKGKNHLALKIRALAMEHNIAVVENPPLARSLYGSVEVGQEIPVELYRAVAEVLAHVYKLMSAYGPVKVA